MPTDHAIVALLYQVAARHGIRHIVLGTNVASEAIMPLKWGYGYSDFRYILNVHRAFGTRPLRTYPHYSLPKLFEYMVMRRIRITSILDYVTYEKNEAMRTIQDELGWVYYGGKHYESIYTRFFQAYVLPRKFNIDKRRAHYSNLVLSEQMTREGALRALGEPTYPEKGLLEDLEYSTKKLGLSEKEFDDIMQLPVRTFLDYSTNYHVLNHVKKAIRRVRR